MKKIIMAVAAIAMAASMFAADISAGTKINGQIFAYDGAISLFKQGNDSHSYANPNFALNIADDKAGGTFKITTDGGDAPLLKDQTIWFKPFDMLKVTVGGYDVALNKETIDWTESNTDLGGEGFLFSLDISGFALDIGLNPNGDGVFWLSGKNIKNFFIKGAYNADFGSIGAYVAFNKLTKWWGSHVDHYTGDWMFAEGIKGIDIGAGYKGQFGPVGAFVNAIVYMYDGKLQWIRPEVFASGGAGAFGFALFAAPTIYLGDVIKPGKEAACEVVAKVSYGMDGFTPYAYFKSQNLLASPLGMTVKIGANGSVGLMGWNTWVQLDVAGSNVTVAVPFELSVSF